MIKKYVTKEVIVIPVGTVLYPAPSSTVYVSEHVECCIGIGKDVTMTLIVPIEKDDAAFNELITELKE